MLVMSILLFIAVVVLLFTSLAIFDYKATVQTLEAELKEKSQALDEAYEMMIGSKPMSCSVVGHDLVKVKRTLFLDKGTQVDFAKNVWVRRNNNTSWNYEGLTGRKIYNTISESYDQAELEIAICSRCKQAIPCMPLQIELLPEYKDDNCGDPK